jgi:hypothetical protein
MALTEKQQIDILRQRRPGKVRISPSYSGHEGKQFRIELEDEISRVIIAVIEGDLRDLGIALGGAHVPCDFRITDQTFVGKRRETKTLTIFVPRLKRSKDHAGGVDPDDPMVRRTVAPYEVQGWTARLDDLVNGHNSRKVDGNALIQLALNADLEDVEGGAQDVTFVRYVDPDTGEPVTLDGGR